MSESTTKKELRVVLGFEAAQAYESMVKALKAETPTIKINPSQFVSFLIADFFEAHFEKDKSILIAEFFDSDGYFDAARKKAKGSPDYEERMAEALSEAQKIRGKRRKAIKPQSKSKETLTL